MSERTPQTTATLLAWPKQSWFVRGPLLSGIVFAAAATAVVVEATVMAISGEKPLGYIGIGLSTVGLLLIFRARWAGLTLTTLGALVSILFSSEYVGIWSVAVFALFLFARQGRQALIALAGVGSLLYIALVSREQWDFSDPIALVVASFCVGAAAAASAVRLQTESWEGARQRAVELARAKDSQLRQAVTDERLRIARDLHDVLGHELAVVNINVGVAEVSLESNPDAVRPALASARDGLQRGLVEMQQVLDLLREEDSELRTELAVLDNVQALMTRFADAGHQVDSDISLPLPPVDPDVSAAAYRVVQEALTNAGRHGTGVTRVHIFEEERLVHIDITNLLDPQRQTRSARQGYGLVGMGERVHSAGGTLEISTTDDIFRVHVTLPKRQDHS